MSISSRLTARAWLLCFSWWLLGLALNGTCWSSCFLLRLAASGKRLLSLLTSAFNLVIISAKIECLWLILWHLTCILFRRTYSFDLLRRFIATTRFRLWELTVFALSIPCHTCSCGFCAGWSDLSLEPFMPVEIWEKKVIRLHNSSKNSTTYRISGLGLCSIEMFFYQLLFPLFLLNLV